MCIKKHEEEWKTTKNHEKKLSVEIDFPIQKKACDALESRQLVWHHPNRLVVHVCEKREFSLYQVCVGFFLAAIPFCWGVWAHEVWWTILLEVQNSSRSNCIYSFAFLDLKMRMW